jgi:methionyl-tRNA synthetase
VPRTLVTSALPYANGPIHFGHVAGAYLPADVYVRTLRQQGEEVCYVCGGDEYGVAITIGAEREGVPYAEHVARWRAVIKETFDRFGIEFDVWSGTSICPHHERTSQEFFRRLDANGFLFKETTEQLYCPRDEMFLADRFVVGTCPHCGHEGARGDECPACATWLDAQELQHPSCKVCGTEPEQRATTHWYLDLPKLRDEYIGEWFERGDWKPNVKAFISRMLADLQPRPITRDMKWGVPLPADLAGEETGKVLYVWFDAPIGYVSMTEEWGDAVGRPNAVDEFWRSEDSRLVHFIGKDNIPFHALVFPSMLYGVKDGFQLPSAVAANEFYNLQGSKFSTSSGHTIDMERFFARHDAEAARFHLIASAPETADSEWRWEDYQRTVNSSLADTIGNLVTRVLRFVDKHFESRIPALDPAHRAELDRVILEECGAFADPAIHIREFRMRRGAEQLLANAAVANVFVDRMAPWKANKTDPLLAASILNTSCEWIAWLARWMVPFMPGKAQAIWEMLGGEGRVAESGSPGTPAADTWRGLRTGQGLGEVCALFGKLDDAIVTEELEFLAGERSGA